MRFVLLVLPTEGGRAAEPGYVHSGHDFRRDSAKLMQASLALAAPKIQSSKRSKAASSKRSRAASSRFKTQQSCG